MGYWEDLENRLATLEDFMVLTEGSMHWVEGADYFCRRCPPILTVLALRNHLPNAPLNEIPSTTIAIASVVSELWQSYVTLLCNVVVVA